MKKVKRCTAVFLGLVSMLLGTNFAYGKDHKVRRVLVISIDGMHALDMALWVKNNPTSALGQLSAQGVNYTNASSTKPSDSIPATVGIFTGGSAAVGGMYYDDAYNRAWFAPTNLTCSGTPGTVIDLKFAINVNPDGTGGVDSTKMPRQIVNGVCAPVLPHNMMRLNTAFEAIKAAGLGRTAYSEKRPSYDFLNGPSGAGVDDLYTPEINCQPHYASLPPAPPIGTCANALLSLIDTEAFDDLRVQSVINEIDGLDHTGTLSVGVPVLFGMNFQALNAAKKDSLGGGYADDLGTPNAALADALAHTDASIGRMVTELSNQGLTLTTAIIITAKHGESSLDPSKRVIDTNSAIQGKLTPAGYPPSAIAKLTEKTAALIWLTNQANTPGVAGVLTLKANESALNIAQILSGESLKLLFPDPLIDPATPDIIVVPTLGVNFEPTLITALPAVQAEHGGLNENETHVPLLVVSYSTKAPIIPGIVRAPVTITQIAPTILDLLNLNENVLQAVQLENVETLPGIDTENGKSKH